MIFTESALRGAYAIDLERREDTGGFFARTFCQHAFEAHGLKPVIAQANVGYNRRRGTIRGRHLAHEACSDHAHSDRHARFLPRLRVAAESTAGN